MPDGPDQGQQPAAGRAGVADELARGRAASQRLDWTEAYRALAAAEQSTALAGEDIELLATAAFLLGNLEDSLHALERAQQAHAAAGTPRRAARCLFWLGFTLLMNGDIAQASGWLARAGRLLGHEQECAEQGLLLLPLVVRAIAEGDHAGAVSTAARAAEIGTRAGDPEVLSLALQFRGRALLRQGRRLLPAQVEIALAAGDVEVARAAADELTAIARDLGTAALQAAAGDARGAVLLAGGDAPPVPTWRMPRWRASGRPAGG